VTPPVPLARPRILLVDDDDVLVRSYARTLSQDGYDVDMRFDGEAAVEAVRQGTYDAVLSDIDMPRLGGVALLERIRAHDLDLPVVLVTGDRAVCREAAALLPGVTTVEVKEGIGRFSARSKTPGAARLLIEEGAKRALQDLQAVRPYDPGRPCEIEVVFTTPDRLEEYRHRRGVEVTGPSTIVSRGDDWWQAWSAFYF